LVFASVRLDVVLCALRAKTYSVTTSTCIAKYP
jgi:hypothetical protein